MTTPATITYLGGPTALIGWRGLRMLTDPSLDPAGSLYPTPIYTLHKKQSPAIAAENLGPIDVVLLSHDHHFDNLDRARRALLAHVPRVLTTVAGTERLGRQSDGLELWSETEIVAADGAT